MAETSLIAVYEERNTMSNTRAAIIREMQEELFRMNGEGWFRIASGSMYPLIAINDSVLIKKVEPSEIRLNDVVLFRCDDAFITHRIIKIIKIHGRTMFLQKGDAGAHAGLINPEAVVGKVSAVAKRERMVNLRSGRGRVLNSFLGFMNRQSYERALQLKGIKEWLSKRPGFSLSRVLSPLLQRAFNLFKRALVKMSLTRINT